MREICCSIGFSLNSSPEKSIGNDVKKNFEESSDGYGGMRIGSPFINNRLEMGLPSVGIRSFPVAKQRPFSVLSRSNMNSRMGKEMLEGTVKQSQLDTYSYRNNHDVHSPGYASQMSGYQNNEFGQSMYNQQYGTIAKSPDDMQLYFKLCYSGDISLTLTAELQLNYPASSFMALPITCVVTNLKFSSVAVVAYLKNRINFCFLEPEHPRISLLDDLNIRSEIGDDHQQVLKNVETVEKFIVEQLRKAIDENFIFPSYTSIEFEEN
ncbi:hypothetical protein BB559_005674 [Furculomyces boomerangus]|uniref:SMP-LTD domain-containing protein n=2 Tax=Harpellales TaxID=61421 RepID=A0A2T9Y797_9FUNG|nr:hypothetical protein BB559_005674 [Furculomyces boomerangus]PWA02985.1 hypothetical protein BB558_000853 [Smittium angustum]